MSDANGTTGSTPPGWYADPYGAAPQRWWDGTQWTAQVSQPAVTAAQYQYTPPATRPPLNPATPLGTVWIWLIVLLPLLSILLLPLVQVDFSSVIDTASLDGQYHPVNPLSIYGPWYFVLIAVGWLTYAATVVFSWLDHRELARRGVVRPFHWAWTFLNSLVYVIGRTVIVRKVADRRGMAPLWAAIGVTVLSIVVAIGWSILLVANAVDQISHLDYHGA
jgi:hypothetical protein